ncbi:hypothetical protein J437_LFUL005321 [Ladona fulva]|uniref:N-acetyltransferase domain-containing protein n=1 Tax=Ladona fulva TaxID=123851 RepID=A0A8K0NWY7_LADFU|nr:hypothetical protein J437_LFUL005321 [Ladona fulva]
MVPESILSEVVTCATQAVGSTKPAKTIFENDDFTVELIDSIEYLKEALSIMREGFYPDESICKGVRLGEDLSASDVKFPADPAQVRLSGVQGVKELEALTLETAKDGISLVAIDKRTGKVAGAAFNKIQRALGDGEKGFFESFRDSHCKSISAIALIDSMIEVDSRFDVIEHYKVKCALEVMFLATRPEFRKRGVGVLLMWGAFEAAKIRGIPLVVALMTSIFTQKIGRKVGMDELSEVKNEELSFLGEPLPVIQGLHKSTILMTKKISTSN